jgi:hypothetical protein
MQLFRCDECGWGTNNPREFDDHVQQQHKGEPWRAWRLYLARLLLIVAVVVIIVLLAHLARGR